MPETKKPILTVAIPTYNGLDKLLKTLEALMPQLNEHASLVIIDNHSKVPAKTILDSGGFNPTGEFKIIRNIANIGGNGNILRCFEYCTTPYLWILGDDDVPHSDSVSEIINYIDDYPDAVFFNFSSDLHSRSETFTTKGLADFINNFDSYSNLLFISNNIYKHSAVIASINYAYHFSYSAASQVAILIQSLSENSKVCFPDRRIVTRGIAEKSKHWSVIAQSLGFNSLIELPKVVQNGLSPVLGKRLAENKLSVLLLFREILFLSDKKSYNKETARYLFDQILYRRYYYYPKYYWLFRILVRPFFRFPSEILFIYNIYWRLVKKRAYSHISDSAYGQ